MCEDEYQTIFIKELWCFFRTNFMGREILQDFLIRCNVEYINY